jgi:PhnB protein
MKPSKFFPAGIQNVSPYLCVEGAEKTIQFLIQVFGCKDVDRSIRPDGKIANVQLSFGDSIVMISDSSKDFPTMRAALYVYVADANATYDKALALGAKGIMKPMETPYGDLNGGIQDPSGNIWWIAQRLENV